MKAITIRQPWAAAVFMSTDAKDVENRSRLTRHTGLVAIHAGLRWDDEGQREVFRIARRMYVQATAGAILGVVRVTGCHLSTPGCCSSPWAQPGARVHITLTDPVKLPEPVPCRGAQGWWDLPEDVEIPVRLGVAMVSAEELTDGLARMREGFRAMGCQTLGHG